MEQFTRPVEGQYDGQETAATLGLGALLQALVKGRPKIFNTDQGAQFTADAFTACLLAANIQVSMDARGAPSTTASANAYGVASNTKPSISTSITRYVSCTLG